MVTKASISKYVCPLEVTPFFVLKKTLLFKQNEKKTITTKKKKGNTIQRIGLENILKDCSVNLNSPNKHGENALLLPRKRF